MVGLQKLLAGLALQGSKPKLRCFIVCYHVPHRTITEVTDAIE
jgi:hypothetical protein